MITVKGQYDRTNGTHRLICPFGEIVKRSASSNGPYYIFLLNTRLKSINIGKQRIHTADFYKKCLLSL